MIARVALLAALVLVVSIQIARPAAAAPPHGLMWSQSALPLTFPLQIRTDPGRDAYVVLRDAETGADVLGAYIEGARFFRVLVPPGTFSLAVAFGTKWQGRDALFGAATEIYVHPDPLTFGTAGADRRMGHSLDLRGIGPGVEARAERFDLCQRFALDLDAFGGALPPEAARPDPLRGTSEPEPLDRAPYLRREIRRTLDERPCE